MLARLEHLRRVANRAERTLLCARPTVECIFGICVDVVGLREVERLLPYRELGAVRKARAIGENCRCFSLEEQREKEGAFHPTQYHVPQRSG